MKKKECPNCHNIRHWLLGKMTYFINLFFIPVIPTRTNYYKHCPVCKFKQEVTREEFQYESALAQLNSEAVQHDMSAEEYSQRLKNIRT
ncbi:MAG: zinc-ribbon domain-containing protein [Owenweeksia sp.]|nr:zinc-ribbon domain-containing protein [Owenweeksia sp.]